MHGRTRILVTHHLRLCISEAKYTVSLANGVVEHAGSVEELKQDGALDKIIAKEDEEETLQLIEEPLNDTNGGVAAREDDKIPAPLKFVLDEERERGAVKRDIYLEYFRSSGGWVLL